MSTIQRSYPERKPPIYALKYARRQSGCVCNNLNFQHAIISRGSISIMVAKCCEILHNFSRQNVVVYYFGF